MNKLLLKSLLVVAAAASAPAFAAPLDLSSLASVEADAIANIGGITLIGLAIGGFMIGTRKAIKTVNRV